jgi:DNA ligase (NAD+)
VDDSAGATAGIVEESPAVPQPLAGKSFCFTGELASIKRADAARMVKESGGRVLPSVTRDLDYLVTNDPGSGSDKNKKAAALGVPILDEAGFLAILGGG